MTTTRSLIATIGLTAALIVGGAACSSDDQVNAALKSAGVDAEVTTDGELPSGFPEGVPTPDLELENGAGAAGEFVLRYATTDYVADQAAYQQVLEEQGFTIGESFDFDETQGSYSGFTATGLGHQVVASAYGAEAPGGGNYMAVVVSKAAA